MYQLGLFDESGARNAPQYVLSGGRQEKTGCKIGRFCSVVVRRPLLSPRPPKVSQLKSNPTATHPRLPHLPPSATPLAHSSLEKKHTCERSIHMNVCDTDTRVCISHIYIYINIYMYSGCEPHH